MAGPQQLHSFVVKFINLWQAGCDASLHVDCHDGQAAVHLCAGLGEVLPPQQQQPQPFHRKAQGLSRYRRRQRREQARQAEKANQDAIVEAVTEQVNHDADEVATHDTAVEAEIEENKKSATRAIGKDTSEKETSKVNDELCPDEVYEKKKTVCTVNFYPEDTGNTLFW